MSVSFSIDQVRRANLKKLINEKQYKSLTQFAKEFGFFASNLSPILNGDKKFTDYMATVIEEKLNLPGGFLSRLDIIKESVYLIPFKNVDKNNVELINKNTCFEIEKETVSEDGFNPDDLFAMDSDFQIDRNALAKTLHNKGIIVFNINETQLKDGKIYLIKFSNQLLLRRYTISTNTGFLETDNSTLYAKITAPSRDIEILGRLVYQINLVKF